MCLCFLSYKTLYFYFLYILESVSRLLGISSLDFSGQKWYCASCFYLFIQLYSFCPSLVFCSSLSCGTGEAGADQLTLVGTWSSPFHHFVHHFITGSQRITRCICKSHLTNWQGEKLHTEQSQSGIRTQETVESSRHTFTRRWTHTCKIRPDFTH